MTELFGPNNSEFNTRSETELIFDINGDALQWLIATHENSPPDTLNPVMNLGDVAAIVGSALLATYEYGHLFERNMISRTVQQETNYEPLSIMSVVSWMFDSEDGGMLKSSDDLEKGTTDITTKGLHAIEEAYVYGWDADDEAESYDPVDTIIKIVDAQLPALAIYDFGTLIPNGEPFSLEPQITDTKYIAEIRQNLVQYVDSLDRVSDDELMGYEND